jgi:hypothetical protein
VCVCVCVYAYVCVCVWVETRGINKTVLVGEAVLCAVAWGSEVVTSEADVT